LLNMDLRASTLGRQFCDQFLKVTGIPVTYVLNMQTCFFVDDTMLGIMAFVWEFSRDRYAIFPVTPTVLL
jgi:hypothetical protein